MLKESAVEMNLRIDEIIDLEMVILNKINWRLFLDTPHDIIRQIFLDILSAKVYDEHLINEIFDAIIIFVNYCLSEVSFYACYNHFVISISSILLGIEFYGEENLFNEIKIFLIKNLNSQQTFEEIEKCLLQIKYNFKNNDAQEENFLYNQTKEKEDFDLEKNSIKIDDSLHNSKFSTLEFESNHNNVIINNFQGEEII